jgi:hypothetical protein
MSFHNQPITWWGRLPVYVTTLVTIGFLVGTILTTLLMATRSTLLPWLSLSVPLNEPWSVWQCLTYPFVDVPTFFTPFGLFCFYSTGVGVETHLGRSSMIRLLLVLTLSVPLMLFVLYFLGFGPSLHSGYYLILVGLFAAFATLYPYAEMFGWVPMKWVAFVCLIFGSLVEISSRHWTGLLTLWGIALAGFLFIRRAQGHGVWGNVSDWWAEKHSGFSVVREDPRPPSRPAKNKVVDIDPREEVDAILEKISRDGISSLSDAEKSKLEAASRRMKGKG